MFPQELKKLNNWVGYIRATKCPMDAKTGLPAKSSDKATWSSYDEAKEAVKRYGWDGVGFCFESPWVGIDLDDCVVNGVINQFGRELLQKCRSYAEYSPSGTGIHIIVKGSLPNAIKESHIEAYQTGRYFTVTERTIQPQLPIREMDCSFLEQYRINQKNKFSPSQVATTIKEGNRDNSLMSLASSLWQRGYSKEDMYALLEPKAKDVDYIQHLPRIIESASRYPRNVKVDVSEISHYKTMSLNELITNSPDVEWIVNRLIPKQGVSILGGMQGLGKTWMLLDLAIELSREYGKWLDTFNVNESKVLYVDEESSPQLLKRRFIKLLNGKELNPNEVNIDFLIGSNLNFSSEGSIEKFKLILDEKKPDVIFIDSLVRVHKGNENSSTEMARVFSEVKKITREFGCSVIFADHEHKGIYGEEDTREPSSNDLRGSNEKGAFADSILSLKKIKSDLYLYHTKSRWAEAIFPILVKIEDKDETSTVVSGYGDGI